MWPSALTPVSVSLCLCRLALYVYEYLLHVGAQKSAQTFLSEVRRSSLLVANESWMCFCLCRPAVFIKTHSEWFPEIEIISISEKSDIFEPVLHLVNTSNHSRLTGLFWSLNLWLVSNVNVAPANGLVCGMSPLPRLSCPRLYSAPPTHAPTPHLHLLLELVSAVQLSDVIHHFIKCARSCSDLAQTATSTLSKPS